MRDGAEMRMFAKGDEEVDAGDKATSGPAAGNV
jgi:hypothetical protein